GEAAWIEYAILNAVICRKRKEDDRVRSDWGLRRIVAAAWGGLDAANRNGQVESPCDRHCQRHNLMFPVAMEIAIVRNSRSSNKSALIAATFCCTGSIGNSYQLGLDLNITDGGLPME